MVASRDGLSNHSVGRSMLTIIDTVTQQHEGTCLALAPVKGIFISATNYIDSFRVGPMPRH